MVVKKKPHVDRDYTTPLLPQRVRVNFVSFLWAKKNSHQNKTKINRHRLYEQTSTFIYVYMIRC